MKLHRLLHRVHGAYYRKIFSPLYAVWLRVNGLTVGQGVIFYGPIDFYLSRAAEVTIGHRCVICSHSKFTAMGVVRSVTIRAIGEGSIIKIGSNVGISGALICAESSVTIENDCLLGAGCTIVDTDFHPTRADNRRNAKADLAAYSPVKIGRNVFIGADAYISKGVSLGENSVIGARSFVTRNVPRDKIWAGVPAKEIGSTC